MSLLQHDAKFLESLQGEDELGVVLRSHIHIDATLIEFLSVFADTKALDKMNLEFSQRVHLAVALGLREEHAKSLLAVGKLRNDFAHQLNTSLTESRIRNLYAALCTSEKTAVQEAYRKTESQLKQHSGKRFQDISAKDQFILIAVAIQSMLMVACHELKSRYQAT